MPNVLLYRVPLETAERLRAASSARAGASVAARVVAEAADEATLIARLAHAAHGAGGTQVDAIVVGPSVEDAAGLAERLRARDAHVALFHLTPEGANAEPSAMEEIPEGDAARLSSALAECAAHDLDVVPRLRAALRAEAARRARAEADLTALVEETRDGAAQRESLLGMVAHDIRAPLAVISGAIAELTHPSVGGLNDDQDALLSLVKKSVDRLHRLAVNLNAVTPTARSRTSLSRKTVDLAALVRRAVGAARAEDEAPRVAVRCEVPAVVSEASVDADKVALLVANLVTSAARFARTEVRVRLVTAPKVARIEVEDDGEAPADDASGDAFGHTHAGTSRSSPRGSRTSGGIGLVLVRSIVAAHGGTLRAEKLSVDGVPRGARVVVSLPTHAQVDAPVDECAGREIVH